MLTFGFNKHFHFYLNFRILFGLGASGTAETHPYHVIGPLKRPTVLLGPRKDPFCPRKGLLWEAPGHHTWSQLPTTGPFLWRQGPQKGPFWSTMSIFGTSKVIRHLGWQIWSQQPPIGLSALNSWLPHTLAWYWAFCGCQGPQ